MDKDDLINNDAEATSEYLVRDSTGLTKRQLTVLPILATQINVEKACEEAGIGKDTYYRWQRQPAFQNALLKFRYEIGRDAMDLMKLASRKAAATLVNLLSPEYPPAVRRAAANDILNYVRGTQGEDRDEIKAFESGLTNFF